MIDHRTRAQLLLSLLLGVVLGAGCSSGGEAPPAQPQPSCANGLRDGQETGPDCGGPCAPCAAGQACGGPADCQSGVCEASTCRAQVTCAGATTCASTCPVQACVDQCAAQISTPTGAARFVNAASCVRHTCPTVAGGVCDQGAPGFSGAACLACRSDAAAGPFGACAQATALCTLDGADPGHCGNGIMDAEETGVDCGGTCGPCPLNAACGSPADCRSGACALGACAEGFGCGGAFTCASTCPTAACFDWCTARIASPDGPALHAALAGCVALVCPATGGGVCDPVVTWPATFDAAACAACKATAQGAGGDCGFRVVACQADP